jgi:hypothetical protein
LADGSDGGRPATTTSTVEESESCVRVIGTRYEIYKANELTPNLELALQRRIKYGLTPETSQPLAEALFKSDLPVATQVVRTVTSLFGSPVLNTACPLPNKDANLASHAFKGLSMQPVDENKSGPSRDKREMETDNLYPVFQRQGTFYHEER